jgi:hypothetical protein
VRDGIEENKVITLHEDLVKMLDEGKVEDGIEVEYAARSRKDFSEDSEVKILVFKV